MSVNVCIICDSRNSREKNENVTQENAKVFPFKTPNSNKKNMEEK